MNNRIYLLTGATTLLGSTVSLQLLHRGEKVRALVRKSDTAMKYIPEDVELVLGDTQERSSLERFFTVSAEKEVIVIHCTEQVPINKKADLKAYSFYMEETQNILTMCIKFNVNKLVYISNAGAIQERKGLKKEASRFLLDEVEEVEAAAIEKAAKLVIDTVNKYPQLDASIIKTGGICGPKDYTFGPVSHLLTQYVKGRIKLGINVCINSVDVRDLAEGVIACCDRGQRGQCYVMTNEMISMKEMFQMINEAAGLNYHPRILSVTAAKLIIKISKLLHKEPPVMDVKSYGLCVKEASVIDISVKELGFRVRPFIETITEELMWLKETGKI